MKNYRQEEIDYKTVDSVLLKKLWHYVAPYKLWVAAAVLFLLLAKLIEAFVPDCDWTDLAKAFCRDPRGLLLYHRSSCLSRLSFYGLSL